MISERFAGQSKYTLHKMLRLALNGITAFSVRPLFLIYNIGIFFLVVAFFIACYVGYSLVSGHVVPGWSSLILSIWIVGGFILISLGIVGTYIGQIYTEVKRRPLYHIQEILMAVAAMMAVTGVQAQIPRSDAFRAKYELKEVVVMSRHNIRSPLTSGGAAYMRVTPHEWFKWTSPSSQLSLRGGVNETAMGQFFRKWVVGEGLLPDNYRPEGDEVLFYANSRQRTFATAKYFSAGFLPFANVEITHKLAEDKMDPVFTAQFTKMNNTYRQQVLSEIMALNGGPQAWMQSVQPTLTLMEQVLDMAHSPAALQGDTTHFRYDDIQFKLEKGSEPKMTGGYTLANSVADALVLQCYESESMTAFGHELSTEQWRDICKVKAVYDGLLFTTHAAAVNLAYPLVSRIREELNRTDRKFMFLCGHDSNLASISAALRFNFPETKDAFENRTPIGSKLVFEKWSDGSDTFVAINLVYASVDQLQNRTLLSTDVPPMVLPVTVEGLSANEDGLYRLTDLDARFGETIAEYDAIEDDPTAISSATRSVSVTDGRAYTLNGVVANDSTRGLVIQNGQKIIRK